MNNPFKIELSDFSFPTKGIKNPPALRCTLTWKFEQEGYGLLGESMEGCLITRDGAGRLKFSPPISRIGPMHRKQLCTITEDYQELILKSLRDAKTKDGKSYLDFVGTVRKE